MEPRSNGTVCAEPSNLLLCKVNRVFLQSINDTRGYAAKVGRRANAANSDHWFFTNHCPAIFIYTLGGPYGGYHSPTDTCEGCGLGHYNDFMSLILTFIDHLEN